MSKNDLHGAYLDWTRRRPLANRRVQRGRSAVASCHRCVTGVQPDARDFARSFILAESGSSLIGLVQSCTSGRAACVSSSSLSPSLPLPFPSSLCCSFASLSRTWTGRLPLARSGAVSDDAERRELTGALRSGRDRHEDNPDLLYLRVGWYAGEW